MACFHGLPRAAGDRNQYSAAASVQPEPAAIRRARKPIGDLLIAPSSTAAAAPVFLQVVCGEADLPGTAGSGESVAGFDDLSVTWTQPECCSP